jgi:tetratricopeptide (TPR) repeat protein
LGIDIKNTIQKAIQFYKAGRYQQAEQVCKEVLQSQPDNSVVLHLLGVLQYQMKNYHDALICIQRSVAISPHNAQAHFNLGNVLKEKGQLEDALASYRRALQIQPRFSGAYNNMGTIFLEMGLLDKAAESFHKAVQLDSSIADAWYNLGTISQDRGKIEDAIKNYEQAILLDPFHTDSLYNLGTLYQQGGNYEKALVYFDKTVELNPALSDAQNNLGITLQNLGQYDKAVACFQTALQIDPNLVDAHFNLSLIRLLFGNFKQGWEERDAWRWKLKGANPCNVALPEWNGSSLTGKGIFICDEQGVGDKIMFASCIPDVLQETASCIIETEERLVPLFQRSFPDALIVKTLEMKDVKTPGIKSADLKIAIGSLPRFFRQDLSGFSQRTTYLFADVQKVQEWRKRLAVLGGGLKVGISWRGGSRADVQRTRSISLEQWMPIFAVAGIDFINLQYGDCTRELQTIQDSAGIRIHDWADADPLKDLDNFAAEVAALDFIISVDNTTVHMAGALGKTVWTLLPFSPDWRWMLNREDTPWYPTMRLFRQPKPGDWESVITRVAEELQSFPGKFSETT